MAAELRQLAKILEEQEYKTGANLLRTLATTLKKEDLIPASLGGRIRQTITNLLVPNAGRLTDELVVRFRDEVFNQLPDDCSTLDLISFHSIEGPEEWKRFGKHLSIRQKAELSSILYAFRRQGILTIGNIRGMNLDDLNEMRRFGSKRKHFAAVAFGLLPVDSSH